MDRSLNSRDQSSDRPDANFPSATSSQFTHSQYPFPVDAELTMSSNYPAIPQSYTQQLQEASNSVKMDASPPQNSFAVNANTNGAGNGVAIDPAMAPPQTPNAQAFVTTASRSNVDDPSDTPMTGDKRKRSKVSRACDECRRKKVNSQSRLILHHTSSNSQSPGSLYQPPSRGRRERGRCSQDVHQLREVRPCLWI